MAKFTLDALRNKYGGFLAPTAQVTVGKKSLKSLGLNIMSVEVETGIGMEAGCCYVSISKAYDHKQSKFTCEEQFVRGMLVEISLGYVVTTPVFTGYLYEIVYALGNIQEPVVTLVCMDVKAAMMGTGVLDFTGKASFKQVIQGFFSGESARGYTVLCDCPSMSLPELEERVASLPREMDDFGFLSYTAFRFGLECFVQSGKLLLRKKPNAPECLLKMTPNDGVERLEIRLRSAGFVKKVAVYGSSDDERDGEKKRATGSAASSYTITTGNADAKRLIGERSLELFAASARDDKTAKSLAESRLRCNDSLQSELELALSLGIPELLPGFAIALDRVSTGLNGDWYITSVVHTMNEHGYRTTVKGRRAK